MLQNLYKHIAQYTSVSEGEFEEVQSFFKQKRISKKENLIVSGDRCRYNFFVIEGCLQMFFIDDGGTTKTVQFAIENWWMTDNLAFLKKQKTDFTIQAVESSLVLCISYDQQEKLLAKFPQLERYFRMMYQISSGASLIRFKLFSGFSKEERYFNFINRFPQFNQRIPQYLIASYLDLTPEYVSQLRAKMLS